jgi:TPR repeat protein
VVVAPTTPVAIAPVPPSLLQKAERGDAVAQFTLGSCYASGRGAPQNYQEAVKWYYVSAKQGYAPAQNRLGACYHRGLGTPQNYAAAVLWYRKAAEQGNAAAQDNLGICYFSGRGVGQNFGEAAKWYRLSAAQGNPAAVTHLRQLQGLAGGAPTGYGQTPPQKPATPPAQATEPAEPSSGNPITVDEIKELSSAGVKPDILIGQIKSTNSKFSLQDIAAAQQSRVDPAVIECMKENSR